ncbi:MAG: hypothetical protein RIQ56_682 [Candidatus Parcubacteria bacterium]|jgi:hypothetical protein
MTSYSVRSKLWLYSGSAAWHFVTVPLKTSDLIKKKHGKRAKGWGSIPVQATIGKTTWKTSIFPDKSGVYFLPVKLMVRTAEGIAAEDVVRVVLKI